MPKKLDLTENLEKYIIDHSESLTDVQKEIIQYNISLGDPVSYTHLTLPTIYSV